MEGAFNSAESSDFYCQSSPCNPNVPQAMENSSNQRMFSRTTTARPSESIPLLGNRVRRRQATNPTGLVRRQRPGYPRRDSGPVPSVISLPPLEDTSSYSDTPVSSARPTPVSTPVSHAGSACPSSIEEEKEEKRRIQNRDNQAAYRQRQNARKEELEALRTENASLKEKLAKSESDNARGCNVCNCSSFHQVINRRLDELSAKIDTPIRASNSDQQEKPGSNPRQVELLLETILQEVRNISRTRAETNREVEGLTRIVGEIGEEVKQMKQQGETDQLGNFRIWEEVQHIVEEFEQFEPRRNS